MEPTQDNERTGWGQLYSYLTYLNDVLLIPLFTILILELSTAGTEHAQLFGIANLGFCASFLLEWALGLALATNRWGYIRRLDKMIELVSAIPFGFLFQGFRAIRCLRIARMLRVVWRNKRYQGRGAQILRMATLAIGTVFAGALGLAYLEPTAVEGRLFDAVWWSLVTVSTVGDTDISPVTPAGRGVAAVLIIFGIGVFGYVAGFAASILDDDDEERMMAKIQSLEDKVDLLLQLQRKVPSRENPPSH